MLCCQCLLRLMISLHLSANSHQSRQDCCFSGLATSLLQVSHTPVSSSLQISTLPPQSGHGKYSGLGRRNFLMPGHVAFELVNFYSSPYYEIFSPLMLIVSCLKGTFFPESSRASWTRRFKPKQHGTSMFTTVTLLMLDMRKISASLFL
jgi:hypothetical protein